MRTINKSLIITSILGSTPVLLSAVPQQRPEKPNIVFILTDDLGWQDVKCYDIDEPCPYETPNIDRFAKEGVLFTQAYSPAPTSSPSRGAIITGRHPARLQRTHVVGGSPILPLNTNHSELITPWYSGRLSENEITIPEMIKNEGYVSGHAGKWHMAIDHPAFPQPKDQGFDFSISDRGVAHPMKPNRLENFASTQKNDPYKLDEKGFPFDPNTNNAITFLNENKDKPFFLYYATWLVHAPIQTRSKILLEKYCKKMGLPFPDSPEGKKVEGQRNPYYGAMVEMMDHYVGEVIDYLKETEDPRWKGHKLYENTYVIFTSDNGGMEGDPKETYTDNAPLDQGKIYVQEGGIRVPMIIAGPGIKKNVTSDVVVSGLDIFPTIMHWTGTSVSPQHILDGCDINDILKVAPNDKNLIKDQNGNTRQYLIHHFPHNRMQSSIIRDGFKLIRNYYDKKNKYELYQLYDSESKRIDIEESKDIADRYPQLVQEMGSILDKELKKMNAQFPYKNPAFRGLKSEKDQYCSVISNGINGLNIDLNIKNGKNKAEKVLVLYTKNGNQEYEEWFQLTATLDENGHAIAKLPEGTTHYIWSVVDNNNFIINYPFMKDMRGYKNGHYAIDALTVHQ